MRRPLVIYDFASLIHYSELYTLNFFIYEENFILFFISGAVDVTLLGFKSMDTHHIIYISFIFLQLRSTVK
jgi:hypothetical protein